jgi:glutaminyl-tRNA synthetase
VRARRARSRRRRAPRSAAALARAPARSPAPPARPAPRASLRAGKEAGLKYAGFFIRCDEVVCAADGEPSELRVSIDLESAARPKKACPKGVLHWVPDAGKVAVAEVRLYDRLFTVPNVAADPDWLSRINPHSLTVVRGALAEPAIAECSATGTRMQLERTGFFVVDKDSEAGAGLVLNRIVTLKESKEKATVKGA